ncbi:MAG: hypothetical protein GXO64_01820 [Candidatus Micrarchaeota archaeon]|nr:hypothetical protein [Candidatus Micrarchaeota archaeon]
MNYKNYGALMLIWLLVKILSIIFIAFGAFLVFLGPGTKTHQPDDFAVAMVVIGIILILVGMYMLMS